MGTAAHRFRRSPRLWAGELEIVVATGPVVRLLGLALLDREAAPPALLIPRCSAVHTVGMRFALDLLFLGPAGELLAARRSVPPGRFAGRRGAAAVLELPARDPGPPGR